MDLRREALFTTPVEGDSDVGECRRKAVHLGKKTGFSDLQAGEIAIVVTELLTNVLRHGGEQRYCAICTVRDNQARKGVEIWCFDNGSGIADTFKAARDGYSSSDSLGIGLGSIMRLSDEFEVSPSWPPEILASMNPLDHAGTLLCSRKWAKEKPSWVVNRNIVSGSASRPKPGESLNGDTCLVSSLSETVLLAAVIDGLGHGKEAHLASQLAKERILSNPGVPLNVLLQNAHVGIRGTRGATVGIVRVDTGAEKLSFSGIGNIEGRIISGDKQHYLLSLGGIVGHVMRTPRIFEHPFRAGDQLALYSDGIKSSWQYQYDNWEQHPQKIAEEVLEIYSRDSDDATILVIRHTS
jgi:anti-sigma regulatory factor (Ser/Thr protein kinase)